MESPFLNECPLSQLAPGADAVVVRVDGSARHRLAEMGLLRGVQVSFVRSAPLGDPIEIRLRGYNLSLRRSEADQVVVARQQ